MLMPGLALLAGTVSEEVRSGVRNGSCPGWSSAQNLATSPHDWRACPGGGAVPRGTPSRSVCWWPGRRDAVLSGRGLTSAVV